MILPRVKNVIVNDDYSLILTFTSNEQRIFDMKPYINDKVFTTFNVLEDLTIFKNVKVSSGSVKWYETGWECELDLCPDTLYLKSQPVVAKHKSL